MNAAAVVMMLVTILLIWGGLVASVVLLKVLTVPGDDEDAVPAPRVADSQE